MFRQSSSVSPKGMNFLAKPDPIFSERTYFRDGSSSKNTRPVCTNESISGYI